MKTITVRLPEPLVADLEAESRARKISKSDVVRERLQRAAKASRHSAVAAIADLIGSVDGLPADLSSRKKWYLKKSLADACLVRLTETLPDPLVLTTDADFRIYRRHSRCVVPS